jgi:hypothetical protein
MPAGSDDYYLKDPDEFIRRFSDLRKQKPAMPYKKIYHLVEAEHQEQQDQNKYSSFESFKTVYYRHLRKQNE